MKDNRLMALLGALRNFNDYIRTNGGLNAESLASQMEIERTIADRVMFNAGWYAAKQIDIADLGGVSSTEALLPALVQNAELANRYADAIKRYQDASAGLPDLNRPGRKRGSYEAWHFEPGYSVVVAMIETQPKNKIAEHIRWGVKQGWLDKSISDRNHARRISLIRERHALEQRDRTKALGDNVVSLADRRKKHKNKKS